jgi:DNA-binding response OmpR family regulator
MLSSSVGNTANLSRPRVLIVDDEPGILDFLSMGLGYEGFEVRCAADGVAGLQMALAERPNIVVLDLMLPLIDGFELCRRLRQVSGVPVIMLTARDELDDRVRGLDLGADDYLTKPFQLKELAARIRAVLRRHAPSQAPLAGSGLGVPVRLGDITLDPASREVHRSGRPVALTVREYDLLELLMRHPNQVLTRETILDRVWGMEFAGDDNIIEVYVRYLRQKLGAPDPISTVRGVGYMMKAPARKEGD